jgi:hypothetical protein
MEMSRWLWTVPEIRTPLLSGSAFTFQPRMDTDKHGFSIPDRHRLPSSFRISGFQRISFSPLAVPETQA